MLRLGQNFGEEPVTEPSLCLSPSRRAPKMFCRAVPALACKIMHWAYTLKIRDMEINVRQYLKRLKSPDRTDNASEGLAAGILTAIAEETLKPRGATHNALRGRPECI